MEKQPAIYIMANKRNGTLQVGVTSNLVKRIYQHKNSVVPGFTERYGCKSLVYYEMHESMIGAITREKQIKGGSRKKRLHSQSQSILTGMIYIKNYQDDC